MAVRSYRSCPPYMGNEPYLYLCFSQKDHKNALPLIFALQNRGCRVWYSIVLTGDKTEAASRTERIQGASLMVLLLQNETATDVMLRNDLGYCLSLNIPIISVELSPLNEETGLMPLLGKQRLDGRIRGSDLKSSVDLAAAVMRANGFSQNLMDPQNSFVISSKPSLKIIALTLLIAALLALIGLFFYGKSNHWFRTSPQDTVQLSDNVLQMAARAALSQDGSVPLTEDTLPLITFIRLNQLPQEKDALQELPNLVRIEIPQSVVSEAEALLQEGKYTIVVYGEAGQ